MPDLTYKEYQQLLMASIGVVVFFGTFFGMMSGYIVWVIRKGGENK